MTDAYWITTGDPPWPNLEDLHCVVCGQAYKKQPGLKPGYWSGVIQTVWPTRNTHRWSVTLFGANAGYAVCGCCLGSGSGRRQTLYVTGEAPYGYHRMSQRVFSDRVFWERSDGGSWFERHMGIWSGSYPRAYRTPGVFGRKDPWGHHRVVNCHGHPWSKYHKWSWWGRQWPGLRALHTNQTL